MDLKWHIFGCNSIEDNCWTNLCKFDTEDEALSYLNDFVQYQHYKIEKIWSYPF